jgi:hypothetical protein
MGGNMGPVKLSSKMSVRTVEKITGCTPENLSITDVNGWDPFQSKNQTHVISQV